MTARRTTGGSTDRGTTGRTAGRRPGLTACLLCLTVGVPLYLATGVGFPPYLDVGALLEHPAPALALLAGAAGALAAARGARPGSGGRADGPAAEKRLSPSPRKGHRGGTVSGW